MTSPFVDAMDSFSMSFNEYSDPLADLSGTGSLSFDDALDSVHETPRAISSEFPIRSTSAADLPSAAGKPPPVGMLEPHAWLTQNSWQCRLHPDDLSGGLESSSSTASTSSINSLTRSATHGESGANRPTGHSPDSDSDYGEMWNATMHTSPPLSKVMESPEAAAHEDSAQPAPRTQVQSSPQEMRTPRSSHSDVMEAPLVTPPPRMQILRDPALMHGMHNLAATPSERSDVLQTTPSSYGGPSLQSSPVHTGQSPVAMRTYHEPFAPAHVPALSALGFTPNADPNTLRQLPSALSAFGLQSVSSAPPQALFVDPLSTRAESSRPRPASLDGSSAQPWCLTPSMAAASLTSPPPLSPTKNLSPPRRMRPTTTTKAPRKTQSTPLFQITTMNGVETAPPMPPLASPARQRVPHKTVRKHTSHKRMSLGAANGSTASPSDAKNGGARLRARGSMMALRQANAMHAAHKPPVRRAPMALSFVNYGINDAEELCSAVAPSGSYKVPLRGYVRDSDHEEEEEEGESRKKPAEPSQPLRHAASMDAGAPAPPVPPAEIKRRRTTAVLRESAIKQEE